MARGEKPARPRGQIIHALLSSSVPLQARFEDIARLAPEHWDAALFETMNPRAFLPVAEASALLQALGKTAAVRAFRGWSERLNRADVFDEERDRLSARAFRTLLEGGYAWLPALAWLLDRLPWEAILQLTRLEFGEDHAHRRSANTRYQFVELAILRENLLRAYAPLEEFWVEAFGCAAGQLSAAVPPSRLSTSAPPSRFPPLAYRVLHLARLHVAHAHSSSSLVQPERYAFTGPGPKDDGALAQGALGHILLWPPQTHAEQRRAQAVLRQKAVSLPDWTKRLLRVVA